MHRPKAFLRPSNVCYWESQRAGTTTNTAIRRLHCGSCVCGVCAPSPSLYVCVCVLRAEAREEESRIKQGILPLDSWLAPISRNKKFLSATAFTDIPPKSDKTASKYMDSSRSKCQWLDARKISIGGPPSDPPLIQFSLLLHPRIE